MYGQNQFSQRGRYVGVSQYLPNYPPPTCTNNWYYPALDSWAQGATYGEPAKEDAVALALKKREQNREIITEFVRRFDEPIAADNEPSDVRKEALKISEARVTLIKGFRIVDSLERLKNELRNNETLSNEDWTEKQRECAVLREKLEKLLDKFENVDDLVDDLKKRVDKRKRKRNREARRRAQRRVERALVKERRTRLRDEADAWIREKRDTIERDKQIEHLRKDADIVLSDVRGKRNDAKKFLGLLQELQNLRRVKVNIARGRGENLPLAADRTFDNIIGQLVDQWSCLDREYSIEEQGLKLMLKTDNEKKFEKQKRSTFDDWERALFGRKLQSSRLDFHSLLTIRRAWDKYANFVGNGSRIPIGWIMPVAPSSAAWQKCLKME